MSCSRIGSVTSSRAGSALIAPAELLLVELEPLRHAAALDGAERLVDARRSSATSRGPATTSPARTRYDGMLTCLPLTVK